MKQSTKYLLASLAVLTLSLNFTIASADSLSEGHTVQMQGVETEQSVEREQRRIKNEDARMNSRRVEPPRRVLDTIPSSQIS